MKKLISTEEENSELLNKIEEEEASVIKEIADSASMIPALICQSEGDVINWIENEDLLMTLSFDEELKVNHDEVLEDCEETVQFNQDDSICVSEVLKASELLFRFMKNDVDFNPEIINNISRIKEKLLKKIVEGLKQSKLDFYFS